MPYLEMVEYDLQSCHFYSHPLIFCEMLSDHSQFITALDHGEIAVFKLSVFGIDGEPGTECPWE
jgi:hypothetical protein